jgi:hypothetical protein
MQGYKRTMDDWARNGTGPQKSVHFAIGRDGSASQYVSIFDPSWHAGKLDSVPPTWPLYPRGANPNKITIGFEHEGFSVDPLTYGYDYLYDASHPWPEPMVQKTIQLHSWVSDQLKGRGIFTPSKMTIIGHNEISPLSRANDPGRQWPRDRIIGALAEGRNFAVPPPLSRTQLIMALYNRNGRIIPMGFTDRDAIYEVRLSK